MRNARLLTLNVSLRWVLFPIPIVTIFWQQHIGLSLADVMTLQAIFAAAVVVFEFPTGYLADRIGHRRALLAGGVVSCAGWTQYASATSFGGFAVGECVLAIGYAFASGADSALLFESLDDADAIQSYARWEGRMRAGGQIAEAVSSGLGGWLYTIAPRLPFWLQVPNAVLALATAASMREPRAQPTPRERVSMRALLATALWRERRLASSIALGVVLGLGSFMMVWLIQPYMLERGVPQAWFGPVWAAGNLWVGVVSLASARVVAVLGRATTLLACCLMVPLAYALLAVTGAWWGFVFYFLLLTMRGLHSPILITLLQQDAPADGRASVLSLLSTLFRLAFVVLGPLAGAVVDRAGLGAGIGAIGALLSVLTLVAFVAFRAGHVRTPAGA
jgi:MFS family permease